MEKELTNKNEVHGLPPKSQVHDTSARKLIEKMVDGGQITYRELHRAKWADNLEDIAGSQEPEEPETK